MNYKLGFLRLAFVSFTIAFLLGAYEAYIPEWDKTDYEKIVRGAISELKISECSKGELTYWEEVGNPLNISFEVKLPREENSRIRFFANCPNLKLYAASLGKEEIQLRRANQKNLQVAELTAEKIESDLNHLKQKEDLRFLRIRIDYGFKYAFNVLTILLIFIVGFQSVRWVLKGFRNSN